MGGENAGLIGSTTQRQPIRISGFLLGTFPVTNREYQRFVIATGHRSPHLEVMDAAPYNWVGSQFPAGCDNHPVVLVSWEDAHSYCTWLEEQTSARFRLPTEGEWEYAARAGTHTAYPWGEEWEPGHCNSLDRFSPTAATGYESWSEWHRRGYRDLMSFVNTTAVDLFTPNSYGISDQIGNVWEWCSDWYAERDSCTAIKDPTGPDIGAAKVARGGSWISIVSKLRVYHRCYRAINSRGFHVGFRVAMSLPQHRSQTSMNKDPHSER